MKLYILFIPLFSLTQCEKMCDLYRLWDLELERHEIYTIVGYQLPVSRGIRIETNVSCPCKENLCLRKCCLPEDMFSTTKKCQVSDLSGEQKIPDIINNILNISSSFNSTIIYGSYCASTIEPIDNSIILSSRMDYCVDYFADIKEYKMLQCSPVDYDVVEVPKMYTICFGISIICLMFTFLVYFFIPNLGNLPGKILLGYVGSLLIADILYLTLQVMAITEGAFCLLAAYVIQFSFLASFFWLNVMCLDLWWTFSGYRAFNGLSKEKDRRKFAIYSLYAWGCPAIITTITLIIDNVDIPYVIKPKFGENNCWFGDYAALFYYFYSFISVLLVINFIMIIHATIIITRHNKNEAKFLRGDGNERHSEKEKKRFYVYLKLCSIMGINWLMEVLSYCFQEHSSIIWDVVDICNTLQGTMIFIIFVCKRRVFILLNKKLYPDRMFIRENPRSNSIYSTGGGVVHNNVLKGSVRISSKMESSENDQSDFVI